MRKIIFAAILFFVAIAGYGLFRYLNTPVISQTAVSQSQIPEPRAQQLATITQNDVTVSIAFERDSANDPWLVGTFTPTRAHFHLYSKDIPKNGVNGIGIGRPTLVEIASTGPVKPAGELRTDARIEYLFSHAVEQDVPIYHEGTVVLRLPIRYPKGASALPTELSVTYMACSDTTCLTPVIDKHVSVVIP